MRSNRKQAAAVARWNYSHQVGDAVTVLLDSGEVRQTVTRSEAQLLSGHTAVIWLEGIVGCYALERVSSIGNRKSAIENGNSQ